MMHLSDTLAPVYELFAKGAHLSAPQVAAMLNDNVTQPAINNRLERLRTLGVLGRHKARAWIYFACANAPARLVNAGGGPPCGARRGN